MTPHNASRKPSKTTNPRKATKPRVTTKPRTTMRHCDFCEFKTEKSSTMSMHTSMNHSSEKKHQCPECPQRFAVRTQLQHHFVNHHCEADIPCGFPGCTFLFKTTTTHRMHYVRAHLKPKNLFTPSSMKGYVTCLTCNVYLKRANMMYHLAQCSAESPFCTNVTAMQKKEIDQGIDELAALSDNEEDGFWGKGASASTEASTEAAGTEAGRMEIDKKEEDLDELLGRVLLD